MDLVATLRTKIETLPEGDYSPGLRAIMLHIETAFSHLGRGQNSGEETAFTDAIYRTNQAFEGSIKEAYRVLAGKDPSKQRPYDVEKYLEENGVFRSRVLAQFTNYRTEWRNPSTHDYKLDFDESEAFLAIVSVSAFACVLLDQVAERISFKSAKESADAHKKEIKKVLPANDDLFELAIALLREFSRQTRKDDDSHPLHSEAQLLGALGGFFASAAPAIGTQTEIRLFDDRRERGDLLITSGDQKVLIELKRSPSSRNMLSNGVAQVEHYLMLSGIKRGILFFSTPDLVELERIDREIPHLDAKIAVLIPVTKKN